MLIDNTHEVLTDDLLKKAFNDYFDRVLEQTPSDEELAKKYPYPESSYEEVFAAYKSQKRRAAVWLKSAGRVAIIALIVASLTFGVLMTNTDIRAAVSSFFIRDKGDHLEIDFNNGEEAVLENEEVDPETQNETSVLDYEIGYIPDGFELISEIFSDAGVFLREYRDANERLVMIEIYSSGNTGLIVNKEGNKYTFTRINGYEAMISYDESKKYGVILIIDGKYCIQIDGDIEKEELIKVARGISKRIPEEYKNSPVNKFEVGYIPEGYELYNDSSSPSRISLVYHKDEMVPLSIGIVEKKYTIYGVDNEHTTHSLLTVNGREAQMWYDYEKGNGTLIVVYDEVVVDVYAQDTPEEIIKIAENIKPKAPK